MKKISQYIVIIGAYFLLSFLAGCEKFDTDYADDYLPEVESPSSAYTINDTIVFEELSVRISVNRDTATVTYSTPGSNPRRRLSLTFPYFEGTFGINSGLSILYSEIEGATETEFTMTDGSVTVESATIDKVKGEFTYSGEENISLVRITNGVFKGSLEYLKDRVTDIDGNNYETVKIGDQWWMAENLKVTRYQNGDTIINATDSSNWETVLQGSYAVYEALTSNQDKYGLLYNGFAVVDSRNIAPEGWHVATDEDYKQLEALMGVPSSYANALGWLGPDDQGGRLKSTESGLWNFPNYGASDSAQFAAFPGGIREPDLGFAYLGDEANFWTSTAHDDSVLLYRKIINRSHGLARLATSNQNAMSVRCVKD